MSYLLKSPQLDYEQQLSQDEQNNNLDPEDLLPEDVFPAFSEKKTLLIPKLQSMQSYIAFHYKKPITKRLCQWVIQNLNALYPNAEKIAPDTDSITFPRMDFMRTSRTGLLADIQTKIDVQVYEEGAHTHIRGDFIVELYFDMSNGIKCLEYEIFTKGDVPNHDGFWQLTNHLIPILKKTEIEENSAALLRQYHYEGWCDVKENSPFVLAKNMGLKIKYLPLHKNQKTRSILFFRAGSITIDQHDNGQFPSIQHDGNHFVGKKIEQIDENTIVINTNAVHKDHSHLDVFHECVHYEWHYLFFRLQDMHSNDLRQIRKTRAVQIDRNTGRRKRKSDPLSWIEYQAIAGSFALWMPWGFMQKELDAYREAHHDSNNNRGAFFDGVSREIAMTYDIPKFRVRARFIRMGYIAARGALNYTDKRYIQPFAFDLDKGSGNYTFFITREQVASEYKTNPEFRLLLNSGRFVYVDGHICLNDPQYVYQTQHGPRLTKAALDRVDLCCLRFEDVYEQDDAYAFRYGRLNSDLEYNKHFLYFPPLSTQPRIRSLR